MDRLISCRATLVINPLIKVLMRASFAIFYSKDLDHYQEMSNLEKIILRCYKVSKRNLEGKKRMAKPHTWALWNDGEVHEKEAKVLRKRSAEVPVPFDEAARKDIKALTESFLARDDALGLAAPQIGISKRIVVFKNRNFDEKTGIKKREDYDILINPRLTQVGGEEETMSEGCLSCPDVSVEVKRATEIKVRAVDENGHKINKRYTGFLARIVQHELDHLDGRLIIDYGGTIYFPKEKELFFNRLFQKQT